MCGSGQRVLEWRMCLRRSRTGSLSSSKNGKIMRCVELCGEVLD